MCPVANAFGHSRIPRSLSSRRPRIRSRARAGREDRGTLAPGIEAVLRPRAEARAEDRAEDLAGDRNQTYGARSGTGSNAGTRANREEITGKVGIAARS